MGEGQEVLDAWDGRAAEKEIWEYAKDKDGKIDPKKAKQCFLKFDPDNLDKQSGYSYPYVRIKNGKPVPDEDGLKAAFNFASGAMQGKGSKDPDLMSVIISKAKRIGMELTPKMKEFDKADAEIELWSDAQVTGNIIERGEGYFVVPVLITREDVYDYGNSINALKPWGELEKVNFDGTPFIAHHPYPGQSQDEVPVWGEIRNTRKDAEHKCISAELVVWERVAPAKFCKDAEEGKLQPVSWGFTANRVAEKGEFGGKPYSFVDYDMTSRHVAYAPPPWKARCNKCAINKITPEDAEGCGLGEGEGTKTEGVQGNDALDMALLTSKIDDLLLVEDDFTLGRKARVLLAQLRAEIGEGSKLDAEHEGAEGSKPEATGQDVQDAGKKEVITSKQQEGVKEVQPPVQSDAHDGQQTAPASADIIKQIGEMLDAKIGTLTKRLEVLEGAEAARKKASEDADLARKAENFDAGLSEAGKALNKDGKLFKEFMDAEDKFTWMREHDAQGHIAHVMKPGVAQGSDALPPLGGDEAGRKQRVAALGAKYYPGAVKSKGGA